MKSYSEIVNQAKNLHDDITHAYYVEKSINSDEFKTLHEKLWKDYEKELVDNGYKSQETGMDIQKEIEGLKIRLDEHGI